MKQIYFCAFCLIVAFQFAFAAPVINNISPTTGWNGTVSGSSSAVVHKGLGIVIPIPPNISYQTPQIYTVGTTISPLAPVNIGGAVPATIYSQVTTYAGNGSHGSTNGIGTSANFNSPTRLALDASGNAFVADRDNNLIRKISPTGVVTTYSSGYYSQPNGVTVDVSGNVYVADASNNAIKKISPGGVVTTLAGSGSMGNADGTGTSASFYFPFGVKVDASGNVFVADARNNLIRKVTAAGVVTTYAGNGAKAFADGNAGSASFNDPNCTTVDASGNVYVSDPLNNRIRKITPAGVVSTFAGNGTAGLVNGAISTAVFSNPCGVCIDALNNVYVADLANNCIRKIDASGIVTTLAGSTVAGAADGIGKLATLNRPNDVQVDNNGYLFVTDYGNSEIRKICLTGYAIDKVLPAGLVFDPTTGIISGRPTVVSPSTNYTITAYNLGGSSSAIVNITVNPAPIMPPPNIRYQTPQVYTVNSTIAPLAPVNTGSAVPATIYAQVSTFAGPGLNGTANNLSVGSAITMDAAGNLYTADFLNNVIRKISPVGLITTFAGSGFPNSNDGTGTAAGFYNPAGIAIDAAGSLYVADQGNNKIRKITPAGVVTTFAGNGVPGSANGTGSLASFNGPRGLTVDALGNLYVTDMYSNLIRKITPSGVVTTVAGTGATGAANGAAAAATFYLPTGIAVDAVGNLYIADSGNNLIRMISAAGIVTTYAGNGINGYLNGPALSASFSSPTVIAIDKQGNLFIADFSNNLIRRVSPTGIVSTLAGSGTLSVGSAVTAAGTLADFNGPNGLVLDGQGGMYITAQGVGNNLIKKIVLTGYDIDKALPSGLSFDSTTGIISGTPLAPTPTIDYTVTAYNIYGSSSTLLNIKVNDIAKAAPSITYQTPKIYTVNSIIPTLSPVNTGGVVVSGGYRQVTTFAGNGTFGFADGAATAASFKGPRSVTLDALGNVYVADQGNNRIRKITQTGNVSTFAGNNAAQYADGTGYAARFNSPAAVVADGCGNLFVADYTNRRIRSVTPTGVVGVLAGSGALTSTNGTGLGASFISPSLVAIDAAFNVYVTENFGSTLIKKITPAGVVTTFAGSGGEFSQPSGMAFDAAGNMFVADFNANQIKKVTPAGVVSVFAGSGASGFADGPAATATFNNPVDLKIDGSGNIYVVEQGNHLVRMITPAGVVSTFAGNRNAALLDGSGTAASFNTPTGISADGTGNLYIADFSNNVIRKISTSGYTIDKALPAGLVFDNATGNISGTPTIPSPATDYSITAYNWYGSSVTTVNIKVNDVVPPVAPPNISYQTPQVYKVNTTITPLAPTNTGGAVTGTGYGQVTTIAGNGPNGSQSGNINGTGLAASFNNPFSTVEDAGGNIYVADFGNNLIRKITPAGVVSTFAGGGTGHADGTGTAASFSGPYGMAIDASGNIYVTDFYNNTIRKITPAAVVTTIAGTAGASGYVDANGASAKFASPWGITIDGAGNLYVTDQAYHSIRKITPAGDVSTFAGNSGTAGSANGTGTAARFYYPKGLTTDLAGNVYVADTYNNLIRKITPAGVVTIIAGAGTAGYVNGLGTAAKFNNPSGIAIDAPGNLYVNDESNDVIRRISTAGLVTTLAGSGNAVSVDGTGTGASFFRQTSISIDGQGNLYVTENNVIRKISMSGYAIDKPLPAGLIFDTATGIISGTPTAPSPATDYTITAYNAGGSSSTVVNITVLDIPGQTITFNPITSVVYGAPDFNLTATSTNNTIPITYTSSDPSVATVTGDGKVHVVGVGQTTITALQAGNTDYKAATSVTQTLVVTPAPLIITADNQTRTYGSVNQVFTFTYSGFVYGETSAVLTALPTAATTALITSPAGSYPITVSGAAAANYSITYVSGTLTITQAQLTITADNQTRTYSVANPPLTLTYTGFLNGDDATKLTTQAAVSTTAVITSPVGTYPITVAGAVSSNYMITFVNGTLTVTPRPVAIAALAAKTTCDVDFDPAATGGNGPITYTSSNTSVAVIIAGKVHVVGIGTTTITATDGVTLAQQTLTVTDPPAPSVTIAPDKTSFCAGTLVTFKATINGTVTSASYQWMVNGANVGPNSDTFTSSTITKNDVIECNVVLTTPCSVHAGSNQIRNLDVIDYVMPTVSITADKQMPICSGTTVTFRAISTNEGSNPTYQWMVNGVNAGPNSQTFTYNNFNNGDMITCVLTSSGGACFTVLSATSNQVTVTIIQKPTASVIITPSANNVYEGTSVTFTASVSPSLTVTGYQWQVNGVNVSGANSQTYITNNLNNGDAVTCIVTVNAGCSFTLASGQATLNVHPLPVVIIPNTFTPNGDAINDTWELKNLEFYPDCTVRIFNRAGVTIFTSVGYPVAWDGRYKTTVLPVGTYYYIIDLKKNQKLLSGSVNLIK